MRNLTNALHKQLDRLVKTKHVARGRFVGSSRFFAAVCGNYTPTPMEQVEIDALLGDAKPVDSVEEELAQLIAELGLERLTGPRCGLHELPPFDE
jgi:hypothetical protein